jgi:hypothetical protein
MMAVTGLNQPDFRTISDFRKRHLAARSVQHSQASLRALAKRYGINQKTVRKWKARDCVADLRTGPKVPRSTVLSVEEGAIVIAFRRHTLLPLDDCPLCASGLASQGHELRPDEDARTGAGGRGRNG